MVAREPLELGQFKFDSWEGNKNPILFGSLIFIAYLCIMKKVLNDIFDWLVMLFFTVIVVYGVGVMLGIV